MVTVLPHVHKVILIDIALIVVGSDAGTGCDGTVGHHGTHADSSLTGEETVTHLTLVVTEESFAAVVSPNAPFLTYLFDKVEHTSELFIRQSHHRIEGSASNRENRKESPTLDTLGNQEFLDFIEILIVATGDTGNDIKHKAFCCNEHIDGLAHHLETLVVASHPVMVFFQAVEADSHRMHASLHKALKTLWCEMEGVGHHSPWESPLVDACATLFDVLPHQGFTSGDDDKHLMWIRLFRDSIEHSEEIFLRHIPLCILHLTVAATMAALQVTT